MKITRLRLTGFKSFVEPTELVIEPGLTGVVGPNGCGKSNLLEALRWVMGETSYKSMRAAAMDDVIFSGTANRPERSMAEVTMVLDNSERLAPAEFNAADSLEITRRIEREAGSAYRINGREVRARDVKVLFEDAATGARSPALVRQGQIGELVNAKPEHRRRILEDAAGIAGLHTRRHEAELRLKAAEANMERLADVLGQLQSQQDSLKRQARQAKRYKEISSEITRSEALFLHLNWQDAQHAVTNEEGALAQSLSELATLTATESAFVADEAQRAESLPPLREEEARTAAVLARFRVELETLDREAARSAERHKELEARKLQLENDLHRERSFIREARETLLHQEADQKAVEDAETASEKEEATARQSLEAADARRTEAEAALNTITQQLAELNARRKSLDADMRERAALVERLTRQISGLVEQLTELASAAPDANAIQAISQKGLELAQTITGLENDLLDAEERVRAAETEAMARRDDANRVRLAANAFSTERETIAKLLATSNDGSFVPAVDHLRVSPGYETALGAALGDDLEATLDSEASVHWRRMDVAAEDHALPADAEPLAMHVDAPLELQRRLLQIGVIDRALGAQLQPHLKTGQRLVSKEGDLWRWDGFVAAADGVTPAAQRLAHKNRLAELDRRAAKVLSDAEETIRAEQRAVAAVDEANTAMRALRQGIRERQTTLSSVRQKLTAMEKASRESDTRVASVTAQRDRADADLTAAQARHVEVAAALSELGKRAPLEPKLAEAQGAAEAARRDVAEARVVVGGVERDRQIRAERLRHIASDLKRWRDRLAGAETQVAALEKRLKETADELATLAGLPERIAAQRAQLMTALSDADANRQKAADALVEAEAAAKAAVTGLRAAQQAVNAMREAKARVETRLENARQTRQEQARRIRETFEVAPEHCLSLAEVADPNQLPGTADVERQLGRLRADRERLGGVNLKADDDLVALSAQLETILTEQADVEQAIAKLRQAISQLNREGKSRLDEAFNSVNGHFERLFTHLFGGGEARLEMIESPEDPLEGGLEIIAKPPGKKPATLSLLSGGEQTLTALSLIFAVFLTNPSPICVLDEVDAPLDDANVERFCRLMEQMAKETDTRFLVITHHPMTMARMNRLFGVTMAERGVSQLVSVDLQTAQSFREAS